MNTTIEKDWIWIGVNMLEVFFVCIVFVKIELVCIFHVHTLFPLLFEHQIVFYWNFSHQLWYFLYFVLTGCIPLDPELSKSCDEGKDFVEHYEGSPTLQAIQKVVDRLVKIDRDLPWRENPRGHSNQLIKESNCSMNKTVHSMILLSSCWMAGWYFKQLCIAVSTFWELAQRSWSCQHPRIQ